MESALISNKGLNSLGWTPYQNTKHFYQMIDFMVPSFTISQR